MLTPPADATPIAPQASVLPVNSDKLIAVKDFESDARFMFEAARKKVDDNLDVRETGIDYYNGRHDDVVPMIMPAREDTGETPKMVTNNQFRRGVDKWVMAIIGLHPEFECVPMNDTQRTLDRSRVFDNVAKGMWHTRCLQERLIMAGKQAGAAGTSYLFPFWDWRLGKVDASGKPSGNISVQILPQSQIYPDPMCNRILPEPRESDDCRWLFRFYAVPVQQFYADFDRAERSQQQEVNGVFVYRAKLPPIDEMRTHDSIGASPGEQREMRAAGRDTRSESQADQNSSGKKTGMLHVLEYYEQPGPTFPRGRFIKILPDARDRYYTIEYRESLPYATDDHPSGIFPFIQFRARSAPFQAQGNPFIEEVKQLQDQLNLLETQCNAIVQRHMPKALLDKQFGVTTKDYTRAVTTGVLQYDSEGANGLTGPGGHPPTILFPTEIAEFLSVAANRAEYLKAQIESKFSLYALPNVKGGNYKQIQAMLDQEHEELEKYAFEIEANTIEPLIETCLRIYQRMGPPKDVWTWNDSEDHRVTAVVMRDDLHVDVHVRPGSSMPKSQKLMIARWLSVAQLGAFQSQDPAEAKQLRRDLFDGIGLKLASISTIDQLCAQRQRAECEFLMADPSQDIMSEPYFEQHLVCAEEIVRFFCGTEWINFVLTSPDKAKVVRAKLMQDLDQHVTFQRLYNPTEQIPASILQVMAMEKSGASPAVVSQAAAMTRPAPGAVQSQPQTAVPMSPVPRADGGTDFREKPGVAKSSNTLSQPA